MKMLRLVMRRNATEVWRFRVLLWPSTLPRFLASSRYQSLGVGNTLTSGGTSTLQLTYLWRIPRNLYSGTTILWPTMACLSFKPSPSL